MIKNLIEQFPLLQNIFFGNTIILYLRASGVFLGGLLILYLVNLIILKRLEKVIKASENQWDDFVLHIVNKMIIPLFYVAAFFLATRQLTLNPDTAKAVHFLVVIAVAVQLARLVMAVFVKAIGQFWFKDEEGAASKTIMTIVRIGIISITVIFLLDNLGVNISAMVAGLGIGGIAIALAAQNILGDLFNYFVLFFDKPFRPGHFIIVNDFMGVVEHVGIKTTRIRSLGGEQIVIANSDLTSSRIRNYRRMQHRRIVFKLGVVYQTKYDQMKKIPTLIKAAVDEVKDTRFDRAHFKGFGDFSMDVEVVYYVLSPDYNKYMDIQEEINLGIMKAFEQEGIKFAYPTQTLFVESQKGFKGAY